MVTCIQVEALAMVRSRLIQDVFWRKSSQNLLMDYIWVIMGKEKTKKIPPCFDFQFQPSLTDIGKTGRYIAKSRYLVINWLDVRV